MIRLTALAALCAVTLLAGCTAGTPPAPPTPTPTVAPAPAPVDTSCDPTASLRPTGADTGGKVAEIRERGRLVVGVSQDTLLFASLNPATNTIEGFDIDMAGLVAKAIFGTADGHVQLVVVPSADRQTAVQSGRVDLVAETMTINCARWKNVDFSTVYYDAGQRVLVPSNSKATGVTDIAGQRVCAVPRSTAIATITAGKPALTLVTATSWGGCLVALQQNEADAVLTDDSILAGLAAQDPYTRIVGPRLTDEPYGMAMNKDHPELTRFVNGVLERARSDGSWTAAYNRWLARLGSAPTPPPARYRD